MKIKKKTLNEKVCPNFWLVVYIGFVLYPIKYRSKKIWKSLLSVLYFKIAFLTSQLQEQVRGESTKWWWEDILIQQKSSPAHSVGKNFFFFSKSKCEQSGL